MKLLLKLKVSRFELSTAYFMIALGERIARLGQYVETPGRKIMQWGERLEAATERRTRARGVSLDDLLEPVLDRGYWRPL
jgi:hypothetical protein